ncbi:carbon-nitrogen hydrolase family protein [Vibrio kyushuensis]|uniref:carbon-nitrogen hydrolase family protein n=1 Tax=Vibrio kyushuensis TaxID=2910249 RepID=UPI003D1349E3
MKKNMDITIIQLHVEYKNKHKNIESVSELLDKAQVVGDITLLPEMFSTGYIFNEPAEIHSLGEDFNDSETIQSLTSLAKKHETLIVAGLAEKEDGHYYNSVAVIDQNGLLHKYRKISKNQIDKRYFSRGETPLTFEYKGLKFGVAICFDIWFPEITRAYQDADIILHPANFDGQQSFSIAQARALESGCHIITCNRTGKDITDEIVAEYCGSSRAYTPKGEVLIQLEQGQSVQTFQIGDLSLAPQYNGINLTEEIESIGLVINK